MCPQPAVQLDQRTPRFLKNKLFSRFISPQWHCLCLPRLSPVFTDTDEPVRLIPLLYCARSFVSWRARRRQILHMRTHTVRLRWVQRVNKCRGCLCVPCRWMPSHASEQTRSCACTQRERALRCIKSYINNHSCIRHRARLPHSLPRMHTCCIHTSSAQTHTYNHASRHTRTAL